MKRSTSATLLLVLLLAGCAPAPPRPTFTRLDQAGNRYPDTCMADLAPMLTRHDISVRRVPQAEVQQRGAINNLFGRGMHGLAMLDSVTAVNGTTHHFIYISDDLAPWQYADSLRHELCHIVAGLHWHAVPE